MPLERKSEESDNTQAHVQPVLNLSLNLNLGLISPVTLRKIEIPT